MSSSDTESYYDSCDEVNDDIETENNISTIDLLGENYQDKHNYINFYIKNKKGIAIFIDNIRFFTNNNPLNRKHIDNIKDDLKKDNNLVGIFTTVQFMDDSIMLIDGHHRITAIRELLDKGIKIISPLDIHNYKCTSESSKDTMSLFERINNTKPFRTDIEIIKTQMYIMHTLNLKFPNLFSKSTKTTRANFPKLHEKTFMDTLYNTIKETKIYEDEVILKILLSFNDKYMNMSKEKFMKRMKTKKNIKKIESKYEQLKTGGCLLGCFSEEVIINRLLKFKQTK